MEARPRLTGAETWRAASGLLIALFGALLMATILLAPFGFVIFLAGCAIAAKPLGRTVEIAHSRSELEEQKRVLKSAAAQVQFGDTEWVEAGVVVLDHLGRLRFPQLPSVPGIRRLDIVGPGASQHAISLAQAQDLSETVRDDGSVEDRRALADMTAHILAGGRIVVSFVNKVASSHADFDLLKRRIVRRSSTSCIAKPPLAAFGWRALTSRNSSDGISWH